MKKFGWFGVFSLRTLIAWVLGAVVIVGLIIWLLVAKVFDPEPTPTETDSVNSSQMELPGSQTN
jgi:hypothetical protein